MNAYQTPSRRWLALLLAACMVSAQAQTMRVHKTSAVRQEPSVDAPMLLELPVGASVTRMPNRQGAYVQVKTSDMQVGWVRMFNLSSVETQPTSDNTNTAKDALRGLSSLFGAGSKKPQATQTATMGIRGLGAEDIANAQPNMAGLAKAESIRSSAEDARAFAAHAALQTRQMAELPAPPSPVTPSSDSPNK
jgi:hypothetical protein